MIHRSTLFWLGDFAVWKNETLSLIRWSRTNQLRHSHNFSTHSRSTDRWKFGPCWKMLHVNTSVVFQLNFFGVMKTHFCARLWKTRSNKDEKELTFKTNLDIRGLQTKIIHQTLRFIHEKNKVWGSKRLRLPRMSFNMCFEIIFYCHKTLPRGVLERNVWEFGLIELFRENNEGGNWGDSRDLVERLES